MSQYCSVILVLTLLAYSGHSVNPNAQDQISATTTRPITTTTKVGKIRDVEPIDPGLLQGNGTGVRPTNTPNNPTLGKQFSGNFPVNNQGGFNSFGIPGNNIGQPEPFPQQGFQQPGSFLAPGQGSNSFIPGQTAGFPQQAGPTTGFGGGVLPGPTLPPGSVLPDTVAFSAVRASDFTRQSITQVRLDYTLTDIGYGWYPDRSEFICYYPGLYFFQFSALSPQSRQFKLTLVRNNQEVVSAWGDTSGYQSASNSAILILNQGDRVYLVLQEGTLHETNNIGRGYTTFSGFRIR